ncbi:MAG: hypothetical protein U1G07_21010 [Verrucomicrobiota bacterium]
MINYLLFVVPASSWDARPRATPPTADELLREHLREAQSIRERIQTGVNLESERARFDEAMARIEAFFVGRASQQPLASFRREWDEEAIRAALAMEWFPALILGEEYLDLLALLERRRDSARPTGVSAPADPLALGESVYRAEQIPSHLQHAEKELAAVPDLPASLASVATSRRAFYALVSQIGAHGVIEIQLSHEASQRNDMPAGRARLRAEVAPAFEDDAGDDPEPAPAPSGPRSPRDRMVDRLHRDVRAAIRQYRIDRRGGTINANNQPHEVTTDVFGEWVRGGGDPARVRIIYADGSEAAPFPLCCLAGRQRPPGRPRILRAALMSMRHLQIDRVVDLAWFRNREVSQARSLAGSDEVCYHYSLAELERLAALSLQIKQPIELHIYHTGFEPASMGFYRAVVSVLLGDEEFQAGWAKSLPPWLVVIPYYFRGNALYQASEDRMRQPIEWF